LNQIEDEKKRLDSIELISLITAETGFPPIMWGTGIIGFGSYQYKYESGREGTAPLVGIAARKNAISLYLSANFNNREALLSELGKHEVGKGCIYIKQLKDIDKTILGKMIQHSIAHKKACTPIDHT